LPRRPKFPQHRHADSQVDRSPNERTNECVLQTAMIEDSQNSQCAGQDDKTDANYYLYDCPIPGLISTRHDKSMIV